MDDMRFDRSTAKRGEKFVEERKPGQAFKSDVEMAREILRARQGNAKRKRKGAKGVLGGVVVGDRA